MCFCRLCCYFSLATGEKATCTIRITRAKYTEFIGIDVQNKKLITTKQNKIGKRIILPTFDIYFVSDSSGMEFNAYTKLILFMCVSEQIHYSAFVIIMFCFLVSRVYREKLISIGECFFETKCLGSC